MNKNQQITEKALEFAFQAHQGQFRKSTNIPYFTHPIRVGEILLRENCSSEVVAAGYLHDVIEDCGVTAQEIRSRFGERVCRLVQGASESDKTLPWRTRKEHTIEFLKLAEADVLSVICADKIDNLRSIEADFETIGDAVWDRFNHPKADQQWYYEELSREIEIRLGLSNRLARMLSRLVTKVFGGNLHSLGSIINTVDSYATGYRDLENLQRQALKEGVNPSERLLPVGDQKTGVIGEFYGVLFARSQFCPQGYDVSLNANHSGKGFDIQVSQDPVYNIQVKTVSAFSNTRSTSPWNNLSMCNEVYVFLLDKNFRPEKFWQVLVTEKIKSDCEGKRRTVPRTREHFLGFENQVDALRTAIGGVFSESQI